MLVNSQNKSSRWIYDEHVFLFNILEQQTSNIWKVQEQSIHSVIQLVGYHLLLSDRNQCTVFSYGANNFIKVKQVTIHITHTPVNNLLYYHILPINGNAETKQYYYLHLYTDRHNVNWYSYCKMMYISIALQILIFMTSQQLSSR